MSGQRLLVIGPFELGLVRTSLWQQLESISQKLIRVRGLKRHTKAEGSDLETTLPVYARNTVNDDDHGVVGAFAIPIDNVASIAGRKDRKGTRE